MTIPGLVAMAQGESEVAVMLSESALAVLTGYLLIAHFIGAKLTLFQVTFVNSIFVLVRFVNFLTLQGVVERNLHWSNQVQKLDPTIPYGVLAQADRGSFVSWLIFLVMTGGALVFMWQVRHPKTD